MIGVIDEFSWYLAQFQLLPSKKQENMFEDGPKNCGVIRFPLEKFEGEKEFKFLSTVRRPYVKIGVYLAD